ncbi:MAG: hypothetical protein PHV06_03375 [bacterium]|nr:hypothetical protein [bacterium]
MKDRKGRKGIVFQIIMVLRTKEQTILQKPLNVIFTAEDAEDAENL